MVFSMMERVKMVKPPGVLMMPGRSIENATSAAVKSEPS